MPTHFETTSVTNLQKLSSHPLTPTLTQSWVSTAPPGTWGFQACILLLRAVSTIFTPLLLEMWWWYSCGYPHQYHLHTPTVGFSLLPLHCEVGKELYCLYLSIILQGFRWHDPLLPPILANILESSTVGYCRTVCVLKNTTKYPIRLFCGSTVLP